MKNIKLFVKGLIVGIGGVAPGLSGSVLMVILGLYTKTIDAIATLFKDFKKNFFYLFPLCLGMLLGIVIFSRLVNYSMDNYEVQTRLTFLGLLIGTIPLFYREVKSKGNPAKFHFLLMGLTFILGLSLLVFANGLTTSSDLNVFQAFILGFVGISATIIPGIDGASLLSALGMYSNWLDLTSLNNIDLMIYIPAGIGVIAGAFILSMIINGLLKRNYTATFSILFGLFLSILPSILKTDTGSYIVLENNMSTYIGFILMFIGIFASYFFGKFNKENE